MTQAGSARPRVSGLAGPSEPDVARLQVTVRQLAADIYLGRRVGTPGGRAAGHWLAQRLAGLGATVTTQTLPVPVVRELYS